MKNLILIFAFTIFLFACNQNRIDIPNNTQATVSAYIVSPSNGQEVTSPVRIIFGLKGMGIAPAGVNVDNTGHHHLLIDLNELPDLTKSLPATDNLIHFGKGQTETTLDLSPGTHTLQLLLGNFVHIPHAKPVLSNKITIVVK